MRLHPKLLAIALATSGFIACQPGEVTINNTSAPDAAEELPVVDPKVPESMDDCADEVFAGQAPMRLLTRYEYDYTIRDLLGLHTTLGRTEFPPENSVAGFENNSDSHNVSPLFVLKLMNVAESLAAEAVATRKSELLGCDPTAAGCIDDFLDRFLLRAFRRPTTPEELTLFKNVYTTIHQVEGPDPALTALLELALQSPQFLYKIELQDTLTAGELVPLNGYELATRMSYFLWGSMPDDILLQAAADNTLGSPEQLEAQTRRMLADPRARELVNDFYRQWLGLDALETMVKDANTYPEWTPEVTAAWKSSLYAFINHIHFEKNGSLVDLLSAPDVFLDDSIAPIYGFTPTTPGMNAFVAPDTERAGLLTQPAVMALLAYPTQSSPIHRGIFVRERLLCQKLPPPPNDLSIKPPDPDPNATTRQVFEQHTKDASCAGCHALIDPIGLGFENYDGLGRFRSMENGQPVDASGALSNTADPTIGGTFVGAVSLTDMLADAREVQDCVADHWFTFAMGHPEQEADMCAADTVRKRFATSGGSFEDLLVTITTSDAFRFRTVQVPNKAHE